MSDSFGTSPTHPMPQSPHHDSSTHLMKIRSPHPIPIPIPILLLFLAALSCGGAAEDPSPSTGPQERVAQVRTIVLEPRTVVERTSLPADLVPLRRAVLAAEVGGTVQTMAVDLGERVAAGQLLVTIDERALEQAVAEAEALLEQAALEDERARALFERRAVTRSRVVDAGTALQVAEARLETARIRLEEARVQAPWAGRIARRDVDVGDYVVPGAPLLELVDVSRLTVRAPARAADVPFLEVGREVVVRVDVLPGEAFPARIERLGAELSPDTRTLPVEAEIENGDGRLRPGMPARLEIARRELPDALLVPQSALVRLETGAAVFVVEDGRVRRQEVELGPILGEESVVVGLAAGAEVVVEGQHAVTDGQLVEKVGE